MKYFKKIFVLLMVFGLCGTMTACSSPAADTEDVSAQPETVEENKEDQEEVETEAEPEAAPEENSAAEPINVGIIASSMENAGTNEYVSAVQTALTEQYADQIGEVLVLDAEGDTYNLLNHVQSCRARWSGDHNVVVIVNDEANGFSDEDLIMYSLQDADQVDLISGVDHAIDGAPESTFVYDPSDAAGCASLIIENASK